MHKRHLLSLCLVSIMMLVFSNTHVFAEGDTDKDGLSDEEEFSLGTNLADPDTDHDGLADGDEVYVFGLSPVKAHTENDERYSDSDYIKGGYNVKTIDQKFTNGDLTTISTNLQKFGLHEPTLTTLRGLRKINVDLKTQQLTYGWANYNMGQVSVSTGIRKYPTPKGEFKVLSKKPFVNYIGFDYRFLNVKWNLLFYRPKEGALGFYIHGAYWHNRFGKPNSHGCVNVSYKNMEPLYGWAETGDTIIIN